MNLYILCGILLLLVLALAASTRLDGFEDYKYPLPTALLGTMCPEFELDRQRGLVLGARCYDENERLVYTRLFQYANCPLYAVKPNKFGVLNCYSPSIK